MKIKPKQYALGLFESLVDSKEKDQKDVLKNFVKTLIENNDVSKLEAIIEYFGNFWNKYKDVAEAEIVSTRELDDKILKLLKSFISEKAGAKNVTITENRDKSLVGGVILRYGDKSLDLSLKRRLEEFKRQMTN